MKQDKVNMFVIQHNKQFAVQDMMIVRQKLENMTENNFMHILTIDFKKPTTTIILAWLLSGFGAGAFYAKKIGFGVAQVLVYLFYMIFYVLYIADMYSSESEVYVVFMGIAAIVMLILFIVSVVNARKWTQQYNFNKFMETAQLL